jgi:heat shock protein HslJ
MEGDYLAMERAYLRDRPGPGAPLFVTLDATSAMRAPMEGPDRPMVTPDRFGETWPGETCDRAAARPSLSGTVWRPVALGGAPVDWAPPGREPFVRFSTADGVFFASAGCNTLRGGLTVDGDALTLGPGASTMMACPEPIMALERALAEALAATTAHAIGGRTLRLRDAGGAVVATLEAVYLR